MFCAHEGDSFRKHHDSFSMNFKMVLNLIWKLKFYTNPDSQCFEHVPKKQLSPSDCSPRIGSAEAPKSSRGVFFVPKENCSLPRLKIVLPSTSNPIPPSFWKYFFSNERWTVLASEKGLLHEQNLIYINLIYWLFLKPAVLFTDRWSLFIPPVLPSPLLWYFKDISKRGLHYSHELHYHRLSV